MSLLGGLLPSVLGNVTFINSLLVTVGVAVSTLSQTLQNGNSSLGLPSAPILPPFLGGPGHSDGSLPWGNRTANGTNYYEDTPNTGVTRHYNLRISRDRISPDGYQKDVILVNGQFPGPTLEANWGDWFEITVHNDIFNPEEGTTMHWHGLLQKNSQFMDGVPGVQQCPITPGSSMTYRFQADLYGSSWYHSHFTAQYTDGAYGPMVIYGPQNAPYDIDLGPVMVSDFYHKTYVELVKQAMSTDMIESQTTFADNTLIQGKMRYDCSKTNSTCRSDASIAKFVFQPGKVHRLRLINPSSFAVILVSIDQHDMTVIANDFVPVVPYKTTVVTLAAGQRTDVLVTAKPTVPSLNGAYWLRVRQPTLCALAFQPFAVAAIYYAGTLTTTQPLTLPQADFISPRLLDCANAPLSQTEPFYAIPAAATPDETVHIDITSATNSSGNSLYYMNGNSFRADYGNPAMLSAQAGNLSFATEATQNVFNFGARRSVRIVFQNHVPFAHPMHVHGQNMLVLDEGVGAWDGSHVVRPANPARRDTQILQPGGYLVVQLDADNPGVWPFHCHFAWHVSQGLYINVVQRPDDVKGLPVPASVTQGCTAWRDYAKTHVIDQIDSGVRLREMT